MLIVFLNEHLVIDGTIFDFLTEYYLITLRKWTDITDRQCKDIILTHS